MKIRALLLLLGVLCLSSSCSLGTRSDPPRLQASGIVDGHVALGIAAERRLIYGHLFGGKSDGSIVEFGIWKLLRVELGIAGASLSIGPLHLGLGVLAYDPEVPRMTGEASDEERHSEAECTLPLSPETEGFDDCPECQAAKE